MPNVAKVQAGYKVQPLSAFLETASTARRACRLTSRKLTRPMVKTNFFEYLDFALQLPPGTGGVASVKSWPASASARQEFDFKDLSLEHKAELLLGMKQGDDAVEKHLTTQMMNDQ
jgi:hypothetical protein